jgi:hypothetical protein
MNIKVSGAAVIPTVQIADEGEFQNEKSAYAVELWILHLGEQGLDKN